MRWRKKARRRFQRSETKLDDENTGIGTEAACDIVEDSMTVSPKYHNSSKSLLELVPITAEVSVPIEFRRFIISQKGFGVSDMINGYEKDLGLGGPPGCPRSHQ